LEVSSWWALTFGLDGSSRLMRIRDPKVKTKAGWVMLLLLVGIMPILLPIIMAGVAARRGAAGANRRVRYEPERRPWSCTRGEQYDGCPSFQPPDGVKKNMS